jgi:MoaA/NifB/PqqE/SkfB family radical SAM enzyme
MSPTAIVQVHLTRNCNLRCRHCYSESGPGKFSGLQLNALVNFLEWTHSLGYRKLALSGGEPFLYPSLPELLQLARKQGWETSTATNGTLLERKDCQRSLKFLDLLGVSFDGHPDRHNQLRQSPSAFARAEKGLAVLHDHDKPFLILHTLTHETVSELDWLLSFAIDSGALGLRLHPLEQQGFGAALAASALLPADAARAYLWILDRRRLVPEGFRLEIDLVNREQVKVAAASRRRDIGGIVSPLVVASDGKLLPFTYGMPSSWSFGSVYTDEDRGSAEEWPKRVRPLVDRAKEEAGRQEWPFFNWFEHLVRIAEST